MRVINCVCGARVEAADRDDIVVAMMRHSDTAHPEMNFTEEQIRSRSAVSWRAVGVRLRPVPNIGRGSERAPAQGGYLRT